MKISEFQRPQKTVQPVAQEYSSAISQTTYSKFNYFIGIAYSQTLERPFGINFLYHELRYFITIFTAFGHFISAVLPCMKPLMFQKKK